MPATWLIIADEGFMKAFEWDGAGRKLTLLETFTDAAARADEAALQRDAHGRRSQAGLAASGATVGASDSAKQKEALQFARRVIDWLEAQRQAGSFAGLRVAAAPRFLGHLRELADAPLWAAVETTTDSDLVNMPLAALERHFFGKQGDQGQRVSPGR